MNLHALLGSEGRDLAASSSQARPAPRDPGPPQEFHRWPLPGYVWSALERRYHSIFCSEPLLRLHDALTHRVEAWVARRDGEIVALILFERSVGVARVLNEVFDLTAGQLQEFARALFTQYPTLTAIRLKAVALKGRARGYPCLLAARSDDYVLTLPASESEWLASLSAQTREKFRYHWRRTLRRQPSVQFKTVLAAQIDESQLRKVLEFSRARMKAKGRSYGMDPIEERRLCTLMRERGQLSVIEIDGEVRAGLLCTLAGNDIAMHVIAHDPAYDDLRLGFLCCALTIQDAIAQRLRRFHFLWGRYDYKTRLGGERIELTQVLLLRARYFALRHPSLVGAQWLLKLRQLARRVKQSLVMKSR